MSAPVPPGAPAGVTPTIDAQYSRLLRLRWWLMAGIAFVIVFSMLADFTIGPSALGCSELMQTLLRPDETEATTAVII